MIIDISDILLEVGSSKEFEGDVVIEEIVYQDEIIHFDTPFRLEGSVVNAGELVLLTAHLNGVATLQCGTCAEPYDYLIDYDIEINLKPAPDEEDPDIYVYSNELIDIDDIVTREFLLRLPIQRRCSKECKGLCPYCGTNLNHDECQCSDEDHKPIDIRLAIMKDFFVDRDREV